MKRLHSKPIFSFLFLSLTASATNPSNPTDVAQAGYMEFLKSPLQNKRFCEEHGITEQDIQGPITLGEPYHLQCMTPDHIMSYSYGMPLNKIIENTGIYMFPVLFNNEAKLFIDVCNFGTREYEIASLGQSWLSREVDAIAKNVSRAKEDNLRLIQNYQTGYYLFHDPLQGENNLTILDPEQPSTRGPRRVLTAQETIKRLQSLLWVRMSHH